MATDDFLRAAAEWLWETDAELRLTFVSRGIARSLGLTPPQLVGRRLFDVGRFVRGGASAESRLAERRPFRDAVYEMTGADGRPVVYRLNAVPAYDTGSGRFIGFRGTGRLETSASDDAHGLVAEIERLSLMVSQLRLAIQQTPSPGAPGESDRPERARLAHELRSPLNAIVGYAELVEQAKPGPLDERYRDYLHSIVTAARHLESVIAGFFDSAESDPAAEPQPEEVVELASVIEEVRIIASLEAERAGVDCGRVALEGAWPVRGDRGALMQVFVNLVLNAVKFTPPGGAVGVLVTPAGPQNLALTVWDEGIGIPPDELAQIFEPGYRVQRRSDDRLGPRPGKGLGLSICRDLLRAMGGDIRVESSPRAGTRVTVTLRRAQPHE